VVMEDMDYAELTLLESLWSSSSRNSHLSPRGWFTSVPKNRETGVAPVDSCHAVLKVIANEGRFSFQRVYWELW
jgi:hypothetical protein